MSSKLCSKCNRIKPVSEFYRRYGGTKKVGYSSYCKKCHRNACKEYNRKRRNPNYKSEESKPSIGQEIGKIVDLCLTSIGEVNAEIIGKLLISIGNRIQRYGTITTEEGYNLAINKKSRKSQRSQKDKKTKPERKKSLVRRRFNVR